MLLLLSLLLLPCFALEEVPVLSMPMPMPMLFFPFSLTPMLSLLLAQHLLALTLALVLLPLLLTCLHLLLPLFQLEEVLPISTFTIPCSSVEEFCCCLVALLRLLLSRPPCPFLVTIPVVELLRLLVAHPVALPVAPLAIPVALMLPLPALPALLELSLLSVVFLPSSGSI